MPYLQNKPMKAAIQFALPLAATMLSGCLSPHTLKSTEPASNITSASVAQNSEPSPTIRYGRYTLASTLPRPEQMDLLNQIIDIRVPDGLNPTVEDALTYVLRHSGYRLCPRTSEVQQLYAHSLPASHYRLGPISLRHALGTLAGPAWRPVVDEKARRVCFVAFDGTGSVSTLPDVSPVRKKKRPGDVQ